MASLARRACYKCGTVGHFAEVCTSTERLCYNCKQPGHESNGCPRPRTTESKQCYHCQGIGHVQAACPTLRITSANSGAACYNCGGPGHLARSCMNGGFPRSVRPVPVAPRAAYSTYRGGFSTMAIPRAATCYKCGGPNHYARDCQAQAMKCYACGKLGHISRDCTAPNGGPLNTAGKKCYRCGDPGHISRECSQADQNMDHATHPPIAPGANGMAPPPSQPNNTITPVVPMPQSSPAPTAAVA